MERLYHTEPGLRTPVYVVDENALIHNLEILQGVQQRTGCHILLAQKAFSMFRVYPLIGQYLAGATASGLFEARLAHEEMPGRENHVFAPAYTPEEMREIVTICDHQECYRELGSQAISYTTGVPAMIGTALVADGRWRKPGVYNLEEMDPDPFMEMLNQYGLPWVVDEHPVTVE